MTPNPFISPVIDRSFDDLTKGELPIINAQPDWDNAHQQHQFICQSRWQDRSYTINNKEFKP